jgi:glycosyltransferase involved in cell wall biosynthesis
MVPGVSIVICCYNSSQRLPRTLEHLAAQQVPSGLDWEVLVIDNASTDDTSGAAFAAWSASAPAPIRVVAEPRAGTGYARRRGFDEAKYEIVSFIDDDNWACNNWVQHVAELMEAHPEVGACGGKNEAVTDGELPSWFSRFQAVYAVGAQQQHAGPIRGPWSTLWGAGMSVRQSAWRQLCDEGFSPCVTGRQGASLVSGEDDEISLALRLRGWTLWYDPQLFMSHYLPPRRLEWSYLRRLKRAMGCSTVGLDPYMFALNPNCRSAREQLRQTWTWQTLATLKSLLRHGAKWPRAQREALEGDPDVLHIEALQGRLAALPRSRAHYQQRVQEVLNARWARPALTHRPL